MMIRLIDHIKSKETTQKIFSKVSARLWFRKKYKHVTWLNIFYINLNALQRHISVTDTLFEHLETFNHLSTTTIKKIKFFLKKLNLYKSQSLKIAMYKIQIITFIRKQVI